MPESAKQLAGVWWYNGGRNYYKIVTDGSKVLYTQELQDGKQLVGEIVPQAIDLHAAAWTHFAELNNRARIKFRASGANAIVSMYQKAGSDEWRTPVTAHRGEEPDLSPVEDKVAVEVYDPLEKRWSQDGKAYSRADFVRYFGGSAQWDIAPAVVEGQAPPKAVTWRGEDQDEVSKDAVFSELRRSLLGVLTESEDDLGAEISGGSVLRGRLRKALPAVGALPRRRFDLLTPLPLAKRVSEASLDRVDDERRSKPDPKKTIVPVPTVRLMPSLAHPVSPNEEQMLRLFVGDPRNLAYNLNSSFRLQTYLDPMQLEFCHRLVLERHDVLRSAFWMEGTDPLRRVHPEHQGPLFALALRDEGDTQAVQNADYATGHQLGVTPVRCNAYASHLTAGAIGFNMHHVVADADAMGLYAGEVNQAQVWLSQGFSEDAVAQRLPNLPVQFVDYAYWQKSLSSQGLIDSDVSYWVHQVTATAPPAVLDVPIDKPRPRVWVAVGSSQRVMFDSELLTPCSEASGRATPFAVTFASMAVALARFNGNASTLIAVPFALRSLPELRNLIGNFLNMMPVRTSHECGDTYVSTLDRVAVSAIDVQRYSLAPFITLLNATQKHFGMQDPSRNPVYATMIDLVPNASEDPSTGLSGVLDWFLFVNTRNGFIWSLDAVYNTFILEQQTVKMMCLQLQAIQYHVARNPKAPVPRQLPNREAADAENDGVMLTHIHVRAGFLPQIVGVKSGWEAPNGSWEYYGARTSSRFKAMSCLELTADYPPAALASLKPPGASAGRGPLQRPRAEARIVLDEKVLAKAVQAPLARSEEELEEEDEARRTELARRKQRSYEVAARWAKTARQSELIPLDGEGGAEDWDPYATESANDWHRRKWNPKGGGLESNDIMGRLRGRSGGSIAGRGRRS